MSTESLEAAELGFDIIRPIRKRYLLPYGVLSHYLYFVLGLFALCLVFVLAIGIFAGKYVGSGVLFFGSGIVLILLANVGYGLVFLRGCSIRVSPTVITEITLFGRRRSLPIRNIVGVVIAEGLKLHVDPAISIVFRYSGSNRLYRISGDGMPPEQMRALGVWLKNQEVGR